MKPRIGIIAANYQDDACFMVRSTYINEVLDAGGIPVLLPFSISAEDGTMFMSQLDGLLIPGGIDVTPRLYGEEPIPEVTKSILRQDVFEIEMIREASRQNKPILAICRGIQVLNVAYGGTLYQDIHAQKAAFLCHQQNVQQKSEKTQMITLLPGSVIHKIYAGDKAYVNSFHHQAIKDLAPGLTATAFAQDGIVEACESEDGRVIGVQWHPEMLAPEDENSKKIFQYFIGLCK